MQNSCIDDHWNVDGSRDLSDCWTGFTQFTLLEEKPPDGFLWSGERLTKVQTTTRPDYVCPRVWTRIGKAAQNREKQEWAKEKPKLDNVPALKGIYVFYSSRRQRTFGNSQECKKKIGKTCGSQCLA